LLVLGLPLHQPAMADQPTASGTWQVTSTTLTLLQTADGNRFYAVVQSGFYSGGLSGTVADAYTLEVHSDGSTNAQGTETCTSCTIGGRTGGYTATVSAAVSGSHENNRLTFQTGSGGLAGLRGEGSIVVTQRTPTLSGTYAYDYHFAP
jgi:hypothetical protein